MMLQNFPRCWATKSECGPLRVPSVSGRWSSEVQKTSARLQVCADSSRIMKLLIVLVNYRGADLTIDCLRSLAPELGALPDCRVGLCENGTGEEEVRKLSRAIHELSLDDRVT